MARIVKEYIASCDVCQRVKSDTLSPAGLLQPLPVPCEVWDDITMDFIEGLPQSGGKNTIFVVVDRLSKSAHFLALAHPYTAKMVAEKFVEGVVKLHGMPRSIISDRDPIFISHFWREFFKLSGTKLKIAVSNNIFGALFTSSPPNGIHFYLGLSSGIIPLIMLPQV
jgi:hypothetical protein